MDWINRNSDKISLFISGWCAFAALDNLIRGQYGWALFNALLSASNMYFSKK
jgi:hypothetical protein